MNPMAGLENETVERGSVRYLELPLNASKLWPQLESYSAKLTTNISQPVAFCGVRAAYHFLLSTALRELRLWLSRCVWAG